MFDYLYVFPHLNYVCVRPALLLLQIAKQKKEVAMRTEAELAAQKQALQNLHQEKMLEVGELCFLCSNVCPQMSALIWQCRAGSYLPVRLCFVGRRAA